MFRSVVLEKDEDQLEQACEKLRSITRSQGGEKYSTRYKKRKLLWLHLSHLA